LACNALASSSSPHAAGRLASDGPDRCEHASCAPHAIVSNAQPSLRGLNAETTE
jgi:hypothetical protein